MNIKDSIYILENAVWELTFACNMQCKHCGSSCGEPKPDELSTKEALSLCDQIIDIGMKHVSFSGGEPFIRKDWPVLAKRLTEGEVLVNAISNGWFLDEATIQTAFEVGMTNIAVSLDGTEEAHDYIRTKDSFQRVVKALDLMHQMGMPSLVCTCINSRNIKDLPYLKNLLIDKGVERWQFQLAEPMGNALNYEELIIKPEDIAQVLDFAHETMKEGKLVVNITDNIGYYDVKSVEINRSCPDDPKTDGIWRGCQAGKNGIGIRCNGDIVPCLSIRNDDFIEGNVRNSTLREVWTRPGAFAWNRDMSRENLTGFCSKCQFGDLCLGGCTTMKTTKSKSLYENKYCFYRTEFMKESALIDNISKLDELLSKSRELVESGQYEAAEKCLSKTIELSSNCSEALDLFGFIKYKLEKYDESVEMNRRSLLLDPDNIYAHKGLGISLASLGRVEEGISSLRTAIDLCNEHYMEPYYDFACVLSEYGRIKEAIEILDKGRSMSNEFKKRSEELYQELLELE